MAERGGGGREIYANQYAIRARAEKKLQEIMHYRLEVVSDLLI